MLNKLKHKLHHTQGKVNKLVDFLIWPYNPSLFICKDWFVVLTSTKNRVNDCWIVSLLNGKGVITVRENIELNFSKGRSFMGYLEDMGFLTKTWMTVHSWCYKWYSFTLRNISWKFLVNIFICEVFFGFLD